MAQDGTLWQDEDLQISSYISYFSNFYVCLCVLSYFIWFQKNTYT